METWTEYSLKCLDRERYFIFILLPTSCILEQIREANKHDFRVPIRFEPVVQGYVNTAEDIE
jgi:hypothetical protein